MVNACMMVRCRIACALLSILAAAAAVAGTPLEISPADRAWLDSLGPLRFSYDREFAPFELTADDGGYTGAAAGFLRLVGERLGLSFELIAYPTWTEAMDAARAGTLDLLPCVGHTAEREAYLKFSKPYLEFARVVVTRRDFEYAGLSALPDDRVAVQRDSSHHGYLTASTDVMPVLYDTFREAMLAVAAGERDVVVGNLATVTHVIQNVSLANLKIAGRLGEDTFALSMAVREDLERLATAGRHPRQGPGLGFRDRQDGLLP